MLLITYYVQNYAGIIGWSLPVVPPMTKMESQLLGTTATECPGLESDATLLHDCFNINA